MTNILLIGVGPFARRSHLPSLAVGQDRGQVGTLHGVELRGVGDTSVPYGAPPNSRLLPVTLVHPFDTTSGATLPVAVRDTLDSLVRRHAIGAVVIATEPSAHLGYTRWALDRGLSVLLDKPLTVRPDCSVEPRQAQAMLTDVEDLLDCYQRARSRHPRLLVSVLCQRRYHPAFWRIRECIAEVAARTGCPVTSIQSFHSDGQWRLPDELAGLTYHGFNRGYGKAAHSGYHFFDIVPWLLAAGETPGKSLDRVQVYATATRPGDVLAQLDVADYERLFPGFAARNPFTQAELVQKTRQFGEVDTFVTMAYKSGDAVMTLGSINLVHSGFSQRGQLAAPADLYKGNGRVRHETHIIEQGGFQAIHLHSLQTLPRNGSADDPYAAGGQHHVEVHVFRNSAFDDRWNSHTAFDAATLTTTAGDGLAEPTQESSRRRAIDEFLDYLNGRRTRDQMTSELTSHRRSGTLMAGVYLSLAHQRTGASPVATLDFRATRDASDHAASGTAQAAAHDPAGTVAPTTGRVEVPL